MGDADLGGAPRVFLSYASEDAGWVHTFKQPLWFSGQLGNVRIRDYLAGDGIAFGGLHEWINEKLTEASVVVAFISEYYQRKKYTRKEMFGALSQAQVSRLLFVPIMLDADAKVWWSKLKSEGALKELPVDYQYLDFTEGGSRINFRDGENLAKEKATKVAMRIRGIIDAPSMPSSPPPERLSQLVILGHPTTQLPDSLRGEVETLKGLLRGYAIPFAEWSDGWASNPAARCETRGAEGIIFVRPLSELEATFHAEKPTRTGEKLAEIGDRDARIVLWLPDARDEEFGRAAGQIQDGIYPALRSDTPASLSVWLAGLLRGVTGTSEIVLQIEDVGSPEGSTPNVEDRRLSDALRDEFCAVVGRELDPEPESWSFWDTQFRMQVKILPGSRAIVAVHDLNVPPTLSHKEARQKIEQRFQQINEDVEDVLKTLDPKRELNLFKTLLVYHNAEKLPYASWPSNGRWKDWRLLSFDRAMQPSSVGQPPRLRPHPQPASLAVFRSYLRDWANPRQDWTNP